MQFTSLAGLAFIAVAAFVCRLAPVRLKPAVLLVFSYLFYCTWDPGMALALLATTAICYGAAIVIEQSRAASARTALVATVASSLVLYISWFKIQYLWAGDRSYIAPLGVSYYTFRLISYVVDVYWQRARAERDWIRFAAYVAFFPHLVAGPIQRAGEFLPQVRPERTQWNVQVWRGVTRILLGFFKKLVVADPLSLLVGYGVAHAGDESVLPSAMAFYLFPLQLYMDFSGLTDIAIGVGLLFGIESPENFNRPFMAPNISEFWRRWHMSLTSFIRDYVFTPLRMALRTWGNVGLAVSLTVNMVLIGIWHGIQTSFLFFGLVHSAYLIVDALSSQARKRYYKKHRSAAKVATIVGPVFTYHLVAIATVFFLVPTFTAGVTLFKGLGGTWSGIAESAAAALAPPNHHAWVALPFAALAVLGDSLVRRWQASGQRLSHRWQSWSAYASTTAVCVFLILVLLTAGQRANPFLYERF
jgi:alginate O-acetyltransferase complex protein AlgI